MRIINWQFGKAVEVPNANEQSACVDIVLDDGRTAQMLVYATGEVMVRGWIHPPGEQSVDGNRTYLRVHATLPEPKP